MRSFLKGKKEKKPEMEYSATSSPEKGDDQSKGPTPPLTGGPEFAIQRIYLKSLNYDIPSSPAVFEGEWKPVVDMQIQTTTSKLREGLHEAVLKITVSGKAQDKALFTVEVQQAGIFVINRFTTEQLGAILGGACPNILFPYAREAITELSTRGTLPPIYLAPINFDVIYAQALQKQAAEAQGETKK